MSFEIALGDIHQYPSHNNFINVMLKSFDLTNGVSTNNTILRLNPRKINLAAAFIELVYRIDPGDMINVIEHGDGRCLMDHEMTEYDINVERCFRQLANVLHNIEYSEHETYKYSELRISVQDALAIDGNNIILLTDPVVRREYVGIWFANNYTYDMTVGELDARTEARLRTYIAFFFRYDKSRYYSGYGGRKSLMSYTENNIEAFMT